MNRRSLLKLGALAAVAPRAVLAETGKKPVHLAMGLKAWLPVTNVKPLFGIERRVDLFCPPDVAYLLNLEQPGPQIWIMSPQLYARLGRELPQ